MYALLAHKRPTTELQTGAFEVILSVRQYTCFNGFNDANVFNFRYQDRAVYFRTDERGTVHPESIEEANTMTAAMYDSSRAWECLGMGWVQYGAYTRENLRQKRQANPNIFGNNVATLLCSERCTERYYDPSSDRSLPSRRPLTPNEAFIARFCAHFDSADATYRHSSSNGGLLHALKNNRDCNYMLYDFVGSERNSGRAVGYLQVFRNWCEQSYRGFADQPGIASLLPHLRTLIHSGAGSSPAIPSIIPTLSYLFNNGSDSDLISFAGANVIAYLSRCGYWESEPIWYNNQSMIREGRYVKGSQSASLNQKFNQLVAARRQSTGQANIWPSAGTDPFAALKQSVQIESTLASMVAMNQINARTTYTPEQRTTWLAQLDRTIRNYWDASPVTKVAALRAMINGLPDLASPVAPTPALPSDGAAQGFTQWVETATVH